MLPKYIKTYKDDEKYKYQNIEKTFNGNKIKVNIKHNKHIFENNICNLNYLYPNLFLVNVSNYCEKSQKNYLSIILEILSKNNNFEGTLKIKKLIKECYLNIPFVLKFLVKNKIELQFTCKNTFTTDYKLLCDPNICGKEMYDEYIYIKEKYIFIIKRFYKNKSDVKELNILLNIYMDNIERMIAFIDNVSVMRSYLILIPLIIKMNPQTLKIIIIPEIF